MYGLQQTDLRLRPAILGHCSSVKSRARVVLKRLGKCGWCNTNGEALDAGRCAPRERVGREPVHPVFSVANNQNLN